MTSQQKLLRYSPPSPALADWLAERGYTADSALDGIYIMRAYINHHGMSCGWSDHYKSHGGVVLSGIDQNEGECHE